MRRTQSSHLIILTSALFAVASHAQSPQVHAPRALVTARHAYRVAEAAHVVTVTARDFAFEMPASIPAGLTTFTLQNRGMQHHHFSVMRLDAGHSASEVLPALVKAGHGVRPGWMHPVGGPNSTMPGAEANATLLLQPGRYVAFCEVPGPDPRPHFMSGMVKPFNVTGRASTESLPTSDLSIKLTNYDFVLPHPLTSGHHVVAVTNTSTQPHMMVMNRFASGGAPGAGTRSFLAWAQNPKGQHAPGTAVGGVTEIPPGATVTFEGDFSPGTYMMICFSPDTRDGKPHFAHGMQKEIVVQ